MQFALAGPDARRGGDVNPPPGVRRFGRSGVSGLEKRREGGKEEGSTRSAGGSANLKLFQFFSQFRANFESNRLIFNDSATILKLISYIFSKV